MNNKALIKGLARYSIIIFAIFLTMFFINNYFHYVSADIPVTTINISPSADSWVYKNYANQNYGSDCLIYVENVSDAETRQTYLKFNLSSIQSDIIITSATLHMYSTPWSTFTSRTLGVYFVSNDSWTESGIRWSNKPAINELISSTSVGRDAWAIWDVSNKLQTEYSGDKIISMALTFPQRNNENNKFFCSKEGNTFCVCNSSMYPYLEITYELSNNTSTTTTSTTTTVPSTTTSTSTSTTTTPVTTTTTTSTTTTVPSTTTSTSTSTTTTPVTTTSTTSTISSSSTSTTTASTTSSTTTSTSTTTTISQCLPDIKVNKSAYPTSFLICKKTTVTLNVTGVGCPLEKHFPIDLMFVLDRSGSMDDDCHCADGTPSNKGICTPTQGYPYHPDYPCKINDAKSAAKYFVYLMNNSSDKVGLVSFNDSATLDQNLTNDMNLVKNAIDALLTRGETNIGDAINNATKEILTNGRKNITWAEILLSDGKATRPSNGINATAYAIQAAHNASNKDIKIYTIGLGGDADNATLREIANKTGGKYYFAPNGSVLQQIYKEILIELVNISGKNVIVTDIIPAHAEYVTSSLKSTPTSNCSYDNVTKKITCGFGTISIGESYLVTFNLTFYNSGHLPTNVHPNSSVTFTNYENNSQTRPFPLTEVDVIACDDGNSCTIDTCSNGNCINTTLFCDGSTCTIGSQDYCNSCLHCGDNICNCGENHTNCPGDCPTGCCYNTIWCVEPKSQNECSNIGGTFEPLGTCGDACPKPVEDELFPGCCYEHDVSLGTTCVDFTTINASVLPFCNLLVTPLGSCESDVCMPFEISNKSNGKSCTNNSQCQSGYCVDGYCCNSACTGTCEACNVFGSLGNCTFVPAWQDPDEECPKEVCKYGYCNGFGSCTMKPTTTDCGVCARCDGSGNCNVPDLTQNDDCTDAICYDSCNQDSKPFTWDYADDIQNYCLGLFTCSNNTNATCNYNHTCNDTACGAECDGAGIECQPKFVDDNCYYNGICNTNPSACSCSWINNTFCPEPGNVSYGICYWGNRSCENGIGCGLNQTPMGSYNYCDPDLGPRDTIPPNKILDSPTDGSIIKPGTWINFTITDNVNVSYAWYSRSIFYDTFSKSNGTATDNTWNFSDGTWSVKNGTLSQNGTISQSYAFAGNTSWTEYVLDARLRALSNNTNTYVGVNFRVQSNNRSYWVGIHNDNSIEVWRLDAYPGSWTQLNDWNKTFDYSWHTIRVVTKVNTFYIYWDGSYVGNFTDNTFPSGGIGLHTASGTYVNAQFDNVTVYLKYNLTPPYDVNTTGWPSGLTYIILYAEDTSGNYNFEYYRFTLDDKPPRVENSTVMNITECTDLDIKVDAWDENGISTVIVEDISINQSYKMNNIGNNTYRVTIHPCRGNHTIRYYANDTLGNVNNSVTDWFNVTTTTPKVISVVITPSTIVNNSTYVGTGNIQFNITFNKLMNTSVPLFVSYGNVTPYNTYKVIGNWASPKTWSGSSSVNSSTPNGNYTLNISGGMDQSCNSFAGKIMVENTSTWFIIDTNIPRVISVVINNNVTCVKDGNVTFVITFGPNINTSVNPIVTFGRYQPYNTYFVNGSWIPNTTTWVGYFNITSSMLNAWYTLSISGLKDLLGRNMTTDTSYGFNLDTKPPMIRDIFTSNITKEENETISIEVKDYNCVGYKSCGLGNVTFELNGSMNYTMELGYYDLSIGYYVYYYNLSNTSFGIGNQSLRFYVNDSVGNMNSNATASFYVNSTIPKIGGKIAFLCRDDTCKDDIEDELMGWLNSTGWNVTGKRWNSWTETELNNSDIIMCSDETYACSYGSKYSYAPYKAHKYYSKPFIEVGDNNGLTASKNFGYTGYSTGYTKNNDSLYITASDEITSGYFGYTKIFNSSKTMTVITDNFLNTGVKDVADVSIENERSTLFRKNQSVNQGRFVYVGWFNSHFDGLNELGNKTLTRAISWAQCGNAKGCI